MIRTNHQRKDGKLRVAQAARNRPHYMEGDPRRAHERIRALEAPVPVLLTCPACNVRHIDEGEFAEKPHHTHACQECGTVWRPAIRSHGRRPLPARIQERGENMSEPERCMGGQARIDARRDLIGRIKAGLCAWHPLSTAPRDGTYVGLRGESGYSP